MPAAATDYKERLFVPEALGIASRQNACPTTDEVRRDAPRDVGALTEDVETAIVDVLTRPLSSDETYLVGAQRREWALREIFDGLSAAQALMLGRRLDADSEADTIAIAFRRLAVERRQRLRAHLADLRRRRAQSSGGGNANERA